MTDQAGLRCRTKKKPSHRKPKPAYSYTHYRRSHLDHLDHTTPSTITLRLSWATPSISPAVCLSKFNHFLGSHLHHIVRPYLRESHASATTCPYAFASRTKAWSALYLIHDSHRGLSFAPTSRRGVTTSLLQLTTPVHATYHQMTAPGSYGATSPLDVTGSNNYYDSSDIPSGPQSLTSASTLDSSKLDSPSTDTARRLLRDHEPFFRTDADAARDVDIREMQKEDPLGTQIWKLYSKNKLQLPNAERMENLTWRMMSMNLRRKQLAEQGCVYILYIFYGVIGRHIVSFANASPDSVLDQLPTHQVVLHNYGSLPLPTMPCLLQIL